MKTFIEACRQQARYVLLPLLLLATFVAQAAPSASFSATATGSTSNLTVSVTANVADADLGRSGNYYVAFKHNGTWFFNLQQWNGLAAVQQWHAPGLCLARAHGQHDG
jgi:hypothetical protein